MSAGAGSMPEFSRPMALGLVGPGGRHEEITASAGECAALATRFGILGIGALHAVLDMAAEPDGTVIVRGVLRADVTQACVVTLDPVTQRVEEAVGLRLLPPGREPEDGPEDLDEIASDRGAVVDLGEALAEQLSLALDPYPRAPGAELPAEAQEAPATPFAALAALRRGVH